MAPKILLADDSMTAQNMGKKILAEGGYDVVTVSNGAAALKKIAELRPELVILDVYMPGYSGLEVCERVRGALETAHLPVMLTVGKLEPFKPEEGSRVKADGLLVKPFEATDLLAAVKVLLEKGAAPAEPVAPQETEKPQPPPAGVSEARQDASKSATPPDYRKTQTIEVPQEMSVVPAMNELVETSPVPPVAAPPTSMAAAMGAGVAAFPVEPAAPELAETSGPVFEPDLHLDQPTPQPETPAATPAEPESTAPPSVESMLDALMPELQQNVPTAVPQTVAPPPEVEFTAARQAQDVATAPLADLEPTVLQDSIPVEVASDAALVTSPEELAQFTTKFGTENPDHTPVGLVSDLPAQQAAAITRPQPEPVAKTPTFEESAASILEELESKPAVAPAPAVEGVPANEVEVRPEPVLETEPLAPTPQREAVPMGGVEPFAETPAGLGRVPAKAPAPEQAFSLEEELRRTFSDTPAASRLPEDDSVTEFVRAAQGDETARALDEDAIAQLVEKLMERLRPELVAAIMKELKG